MTYYVYCAVDISPCPPENQMIAAEPTALDYAALGLTGTSLSTAIGIGFGVVLTFAMLGYAVGLAVKLINRYL